MIGDEPTASDEGGRATAVRWVPAVATLLALSLRLPALGEAPLWPDEAATWWYSRWDAAGSFLERMRLEPTPPLYYALVGLWTKVFGDGVVALRLPSVVAGVAAIPLVHRVGLRLFGPLVAGAAAVLLALHPLHVVASREARVYPFLILLVLGIVAATDRVLTSGSGRAGALLALLLAATGWSHPYGLFVLGACAIVVLVQGEGRARWRGLAAVAAAGLAIAPWWAMTLPHLRESGAAWSVEEMYGMLPDEARMGRALEISLVGAAYNPFLRVLDRPPTPAVVRWSALLVQLGLLAAVAAGAARREGWRRPVGLLTVVWGCLVLVPWAVTRLGPPIYHLGRHDLYVLGPVVLLLAAGWGWVFARRQTAALVAAAVILLAAGHRLVALHRAPPDLGDRLAGRFLAEREAPGDVALAFGIRRLATEHPARRAGASMPFRSFPPETDLHPGWSDDRSLAEDLAELRQEAAEVAEELEGKAERVFLLVREYPEGQDRSPTLAWLVDGQLLALLQARGWRLDPEASDPSLGLRAVRPPEEEPWRDG